jgi:hypothetical protein
MEPRTSQLVQQEEGLEMRAVLWISAALLVCVGPVLADNVVSDFEDGTLQGWTPEPPFNGELFVAPPGNPGFSMQATDDLPGGGPLLARAPASYAGDLSGFIGISWDEYILDYGDPTIIATHVEIRGSDGTTYRTDNTLGPTEVWNPRFVPFVEELWTLEEGTASFLEVLENVEALLVQMDVTALDNGILESRVDNVTLLESPTPIRETTWGMIKALH